MKHFAMKSLAVAALAAIAAPSFAQNTNNNTMTNIVQVQGNCDIVAVGVDFGVINSPTVLAGPVVTANTATGNGATGTTHNMKGYDGTGGSNPDVLARNPEGTNDDGTSRRTGDDTLALKGSIFTVPVVGAAVSSTLSSVVSQLPDAVPGVYVSCSTAPDRIYVTSGNSTASITLFGTGAPAGGTVVDVSGDATALPGALTGALPLAVGFNPDFALNSTLNYAPGGTPTATPGASERIDYALQFSPTSVNIALELPGVPAINTPLISVPAVPPQTLGTFLGVYPAAGFIRTANQPAREGDFADIALATVEY